MSPLWDAIDPYPRPRRDRGRGIPTNGDQAVSVDLPRVYLWSWHLRQANAGAARATVCSRRVRGPAFLDWVTLGVSAGGSAVTYPVLQLGYAISAVTEGTDQAVAEPPGVTWFTEHDFQDDGGFADTGADGIYLGQEGTTVNPFILRLGIPLQTAEFFLVASLRMQAGAAHQYNAVVRVLESVSPDLLGEMVLR